MSVNRPPVDPYKYFNEVMFRPPIERRENNSFSSNTESSSSLSPSSSVSCASTAMPSAASSQASQDGILGRVSVIAQSVLGYTRRLFSSNANQRKESESSAAASSSLASATVFPSASTLAQGSSSISHSESSSSSSASSSIGNAPSSSASSLSASSNAMSRAAPSSAPASLASASSSLASVTPFPATHALVAQSSSSSSSQESSSSSNAPIGVNGSNAESFTSSSVSCSSTASANSEAVSRVAGHLNSNALTSMPRTPPSSNQNSNITVDREGHRIIIGGRKYILVQVNRDGSTESVTGDSLSPVLQRNIATIYGIFAEILRTTQNSSENMAKAQYTVTYQIPNLQAPTIKKVVQKTSNSRGRSELSIPLSIPLSKRLKNSVYGISTVQGAFSRIIDLLKKPQLTINGFGDSRDNPLSRRKIRILQKLEAVDQPYHDLDQLEDIDPPSGRATADS